MTYNDITKAIDNAIKNKDAEAIMQLISNRNRITIDRHNAKEAQKKVRYLGLKKTFKYLDKMSFEEMDKVFDAGLSKEEIERELLKLK